MNISSKIRSSQLIAGFLTVVVAIFSASAAQAQILLKIDDSNPGATVITATVTDLSNSAGATTSVDAFPIQNGVDLLSFLNANIGSFPSFSETTPGTSSLVAGNGSSLLTFNQAVVDNSSGLDRDLGLYNGDSSATVSFTEGVAAFTGTLTLDLSSQAGNLPAIGTSGTVQTGYNGPDNTGGPHAVIGQWEIVSPVSAPEPSTWALLLAALAGLPFVRRFRLN